MFDLSFGKILMLLIVGLIVIGPAKLPIVLKKVIDWINALRRLSATVQMELNKELKIQEIQNALNKVEKMNADDVSPDLQFAIDELKRLTDSLKMTSTDVSSEVNHSLKTIEHELGEGNNPPKANDITSEAVKN